MTDKHEELELNAFEEDFLAEDHDPEQFFQALTNALGQLEQWVTAEAA